MKKSDFAKRGLALVLMAVVLMGLAACSKDSNTAPVSAGGDAAAYTGQAEIGATEADGYWIDCTTCRSTGVCKYCDGSGRTSTGRMCTNCDGSGNCSRCAGKGQRELIMVNGKEYVVCGSCLGTTLCKSCGGSGKGDPGSLLGSSYGTECYLCKGKGKCSICKGKGYTSW